jgi:hypothetical protein
LVVDEKAGAEDADPDAAMSGAPTAFSCWAVHLGSISKMSAWQLQHRNAMRASPGSTKSMMALTARRPGGLARVCRRLRPRVQRIQPPWNARHKIHL